MSKLLSIICAVVIFCVIVIIHEFGHFFVARLCGIDVHEFSVGMGPALFKKKGKNTLFTVRLLPLGGYCSFADDVEEAAENGFRKASVWSRIAVTVAGAIMNLFLGFIIGIIILLITGKYTTSIVAEVGEGTGCEQAGMQINDEIVEINGLHIFTANDIIYQLRNDEDGMLDFVIRRNGELMPLNSVKFNVAVDESTGERTLTYDFKVYNKHLEAAELLPQAGAKFMYYSRLIILSLKDLITGKYGINNLQGPVGVVTVITESAEQSGFDIEFLLDVGMLITVNLGIFNLLPIPALDGGKLLIYLIEIIRRKPMKAETEGVITFAGFAMLMLLMLAVTFNDIKNLFV